MLRNVVWRLLANYQEAIIALVRTRERTFMERRRQVAELKALFEE